MAWHNCPSSPCPYCAASFYGPTSYSTGTPNTTVTWNITATTLPPLAKPSRFDRALDAVDEWCHKHLPTWLHKPLCDLRERRLTGRKA